MNHGILFLNVLDTESLSSGCQHGGVLVKTLFGLKTPFHISMWWEKGTKALWSGLHRALVPFPSCLLPNLCDLSPYQIP